MNKKERFSIRKRMKSFVYAFRGIKLLIGNEHNARIHLVALVCVLIAGTWLGLSQTEWIAVCIVSGAVFCAEAFNSAIEVLADHVCPQRNEAIRTTKDLASGAVLCMAIAAAVVGMLIFIPKLIVLYNKMNL